MPFSHEPSRSPRRRQRLRAELLFALRALRSIGRPMLLLAVVWALGGVAQRYWGAPPGAEPPSWSSAFFQSYGLLLLEHLERLPAHPIGQFTYYVQPILGSLLLAEGLIKLGITVFRKELNAEAWVEILAKASRGHVIVCGIGNVGYRVIEELTRLGELVFAVDKDPDCAFLERARELGATIYVGDARSERIFQKLNLAEARAVIIATNDDLANLEIAMDVRELRSDVAIVMRLFDQQLARKVKATLGVDVSLSASALAAPLFAGAALDRSVVGTHRVGEDLLVMVELAALPNGRLAGTTVGALSRDHGLTVVAIRPEHGAWTLQPTPEATVKAGDRLQLLIHSRRVEQIHVLNGER